MQEFLIELGFKKYDLALLILCPLGAMIGSFAHALLLTTDPHSVPKPGSTQFNSLLDMCGRAAWLCFRLCLGAILGLIVGLYFIGALQENVATLAKVVALSILLGFAAPRVWTSQEKIIAEVAEQRLKEIFGLQSDAAHENVKVIQLDGKGDRPMAQG